MAAKSETCSGSSIGELGEIGESVGAGDSTKEEEPTDDPPREGSEDEDDDKCGRIGRGSVIGAKSYCFSYGGEKMGAPSKVSSSA